MTNINHIPFELILRVQAAIKERKLLEKIANNYCYQEQLGFQSNLKILANQLVQNFQMPPQPAHSLKEFMVDKNLPIQFTLKPLRLTHLIDFLSDWLNISSLNSSQQRNTTVLAYRNLLFKTILTQEKQTIDDYFTTLSKKNMLISDDLFNLLQNILSPYFLYQYQNDRQTFFNKQNAIESFKQLINKYAICDHRTIISPQLQNSKYIRRCELQNLIQFWQAANQELVLRTEVRKTTSDIGIQTQLNHNRDLQVQTEHQNITILNLINSTLLKLNSSTQEGKHSEALQRICAFLRAQKINLLRKQQKQKGGYPSPPKTQKYKLTASRNLFQEIPKPSPLSLCGTPKISSSKLWQKCNQTDEKQTSFLAKSSQTKINSTFCSLQATVQFPNK